LVGSSGADDLLFGGDGNDFFYLSGGKDVFSGDLGTDVLALSRVRTH
jgi:Ca2+-binding RTX toxin-like protein